MAGIGARDFGGVEHEFDFLRIAFIDDVDFDFGIWTDFEEGSAPFKVGSNIGARTGVVATGVDDGDVMGTMGFFGSDVDADIDGRGAEVLNFRGEGILGCRIGWEISPNGLVVGFKVGVADFGSLVLLNTGDGITAAGGEG